MTLARQTQTNFTSGEVSPRLLGRTDIAKYYNGVSRLENFIVQQHGPITRRPGTRFVADNISGSAQTRLVPFQFSVTQTFMLAFQDDGNLFFYKDTGPVSIGASTGVSYTSDGTTSVLVTFDRPHGYSTAETLTVANATDGDADGTTLVITSVPSNLTLIYTADQVVAAGTPATDTLDISPDSADAYYTIRHAYIGVDLDELQYTQLGDLLYVCDGTASLNVFKLSRFGDADWDIGTVDFVDGPFLPENETADTIDVGAITWAVGNVVETQSNTEELFTHDEVRDLAVGLYQGTQSGTTVTMELNSPATSFVQGDLIDISGCDEDGYNGNGFAITSVSLNTTPNPDRVEITYEVVPTGLGNAITSPVDWAAQDQVIDPPVVRKHRLGLEAVYPGRLLRHDLTADHTISVELYRWHDENECSVIVRKMAASPQAADSSLWQLGVFSKTRGYPTAISGHQSRLLLGKDFTVHASNIGLLEDFTPSDIDDYVVDSTHSWDTAFIGDQVNNVVWLASSPNGLMVGTQGAEYTVTDLGSSSVLNPVDGVATTIVTTYGTESGTVPVQIGGSVLFVQSGGQKLRDLHFTFDRDSHVGQDLTLLSEHITADRITDISYQQDPNSIIWCLTGANELLTLTFEPDQEVAAWAVHTLGGSDVTIDTIAVVKDVDGLDTVDRLWLVVNRTVNGGTVRYVEYMEKAYTINDKFYDSTFVDSAISNAPIVLSNTATAAFVFTDSAGTPFLDGNTGVTVVGVGTPFAGLTDPTPGPASELAFYDIDMNLVAKCVITSNDPFTNTITVTMRNNEFAASSPNSSAYYCVEEVTVLPGLDHLEGEEVAINADGVTDVKTVSSGSVTLTNPAAYVTVGLNYVSEMESLPIAIQALAGVDLHARMSSIGRAHLRFYETSKFWLGDEKVLDQLYAHTLRREKETDETKVLQEQRSGLFSYSIGSVYDPEPKLLITSGSTVIAASGINNALPITVLSYTLDMDVNAPA